MNNRNLIVACCVLSIIYCVLYIALTADYSSYGIDDSNGKTNTVVTLSNATATVNGETEEITLPYEFSDLEPRTLVTIEATFQAPEGGFFYAQAEYTPITIYANDNLIYSYGEEGSYPETLVDPAYHSEIVALNVNEETVTFTMNYYSPIIADSFTVEPVIFGTQAGLYNAMFSDLGFTLIFSIVLILASVFMICIIIIIIMIFERRSITFLWLGLACLTSGIWLLYDNALLGLFVDNPTRMFIMSFYGMVVFPTPLIYFALTTVNFHNKKPLYYLAIIRLISSSCAILSQLLGIVSAITLERIFSTFVPCSVTLFALCLLYEYIHYHNNAAQRFAIPSVILAIFTILDFLNSQLHFANSPITFFQIGIMIFMLSMGIIGGYYIKDSINIREHSKQMEFHVHLIEYQTKNLKRHSSLIMETSENLKKQRHDLRHQLTVIKELANQDTTEQLNSYLDTIITNIPSEQLFYCNNVTINSILSHYAAICHRLNIRFDVDISIPSHSTDTLDTDYCIIFGNLLENATEACQYMIEGNRFISLHTRMRYNTLIVSMENSFDGQYKEEHGRFHSRKRADYGIGLTSIQASANKYGGDAQFKSNGCTFLSSVYMTIFNETTQSN